MKNYIQVVTTTEKKEDAQKIATDLVRKRLVACAQVIGPVSSTYWWREKIEEAEEWLCIMKSRKELYEQIEETLRRIHPYEEPEVLATPIVEGSRSYLAWLDEQVTAG